MVETSNDLLLEILRKIQADQSDLKKDNREIKESLSRIERQVHSLRGDVQELRGDFSFSSAKPSPAWKSAWNT